MKMIEPWERLLTQTTRETINFNDFLIIRPPQFHPLFMEQLVIGRWV
jgi:hypothetical protein